MRQPSRIIYPEYWSAMTGIDLQEIARNLLAQLREHGREFDPDSPYYPLDTRMLLVQEEAGELAGAYRRWSGRARRNGTLGEVEEEVADVLISTAAFAEMMGINIAAAVEGKLSVIYSRGWQEGHEEG